MNKLVFSETMRVLFPNVTVDDDLYQIKFGDFAIYNSRLVDVVGKIPYEVVMRVYEKYHDCNYDIRVGSIGISDNPIPFLKDDIYKSEIVRGHKNESVDRRSERINAAYSSLQRRSDKSKYLEKYRIGDKEGLVVVISELLDYLARSEMKESHMVDCIGETIATINANILKRINPQIPLDTWMNETINFRTYSENLRKSYSDPTLNEFRRVLNVFDRIVNPFMEGDLPLEVILGRLENLSIDVYPLSHDVGFEDKFTFYRTVMDDKGSLSELSFGRTPLGFDYLCRLDLGDKVGMVIRHYYGCDEEKTKCGEIISISRYDRRRDFRSCTVYNITNNTLVDEKGKAKPCSGMELGMLYLDLCEAVNLMSQLTIDRLNEKKTIRLDSK